VLPRWARIVYSPHCFGFERRDLGPVARFAVRAIEEALAPLHDGIAAIGAHEAALARGLKLNRRTWVVPNSVSIEPPPVANARTDGRLCIGMVGRTAPQKGVDFFIESVRRLPPERFRALWIGGGDEAGQRALRAAGIEVTGWVPRAEVLARLATEVDLYLHTARWEGTPITLLEAAALGLPIVCRDIEHLRDVPLGARVRSPEAAAAAVVRLGDPAERARAQVANARILAQFSPQHTRAALLAAYADCRQVSRAFKPTRDASPSTVAQPLLRASSPPWAWTSRPRAR
jgi:glycosyltransferase involved in cell wall biosynthesis